MKKRESNLLKAVLAPIFAFVLAVLVRVDAFADGYGAVVNVTGAGGNSPQMKVYFEQNLYLLDDNANSTQYIGLTNHIKPLADNQTRYTLIVNITLGVNGSPSSYRAYAYPATVDECLNLSDNASAFYAYRLDGTPVTADDMVYYYNNNNPTFGSFFWVNGSVPQRYNLDVTAPDMEVEYTINGNGEANVSGATIVGDAHGITIGSDDLYIEFSHTDITGDYVTKYIRTRSQTYGLSASSTVRVKVNPMNVSSTDFSYFLPQSGVYEATGSEVCPDLQSIGYCVDASQNRYLNINKGTDYSISYENNVYASDNARMILTFCGRYTGQKVIPFTIRRANLTEDDVELSIANWTEGDMAASPVVVSEKFVSEANEGGTIEYTYYERGSETPLEEVPATPGEYTLKAVLPAGRIYTGIEATCDFRINSRPAPVHHDDDSNANVQPVTPAVKEQVPAPAAPVKKAVTEKKTTVKETVNVTKETSKDLEETTEEIKEEQPEETPEEVAKAPSQEVTQAAAPVVEETHEEESDAKIENVKERKPLSGGQVAAVVVGGTFVLAGAGIGVSKWLVLLKK